MGARTSQTLKDLDVVYGGPYAHETDAIYRELNLAAETGRDVNFDAVVSDWPNISNGALEFIRQNGQPDETPEIGVVYQNVLFDEDAPTNTQPEVVAGEIDMPAPLAGFIPVETFTSVEDEVEELFEEAEEETK